MEFQLKWGYWEFIILRWIISMVRLISHVWIIIRVLGISSLFSSRMGTAIKGNYNLLKGSNPCWYPCDIMTCFPLSILRIEGIQNKSALSVNSENTVRLIINKRGSTGSILIIYYIRSKGKGRKIRTKLTVLKDIREKDNTGLLVIWRAILASFSTISNVNHDIWSKC